MTLGLVLLGLSDTKRGDHQNQYRPLSKKKLNLITFTGQLTLLELSWLDGWTMALFFGGLIPHSGQIHQTEPEETTQDMQQ